MSLPVRLPTKSVWSFLFLVFIFRMVYIYIIPLQLVPDEAYYWDWSRHLDIGYFSKPPMVAWLNYISQKIFGINEIGVRFFAALLGTGSVGVVYLLAKKMFDEEVGIWALAISLLTPANCALSLIMTIDPPLVFFGILSLFFLWKATSAQDNKKIFYFALLGLSTGLGILSKQMMLIYFLLVFVFLFIERELRPLIFSKAFFIFILISMLCFFLPLYWNFKHGWVTFQETAHHFSSNSSILDCFRTFFEYIGGQLLIITPVFCAIIYVSIKQGILNFKVLDRRLRFLFIFGCLPLTLFLLNSLKQRINANWPALFYPPAIIFASAWFLKDKIQKNKIKRYLNLGLIVAYLFVFLTYISPFIFTIDCISGLRIDPTTRAKGWKELAAEVEKVYKHIKNKEDKLFLLSERRDTISELAFYLPEHPIIYKWDRTKNIIKDQYEIWGGPDNSAIGKDCLIILKKGVDIKELIPYFKEARKLKNIKIKLGKYSFRHYEIYKGVYFKGWNNIS